ncbi:acyltransferase family protein [Microbacterium sp. MAHUQ-60]|uniref:acyltransferase family protein n=1 Tax=unclassified Microbacterium TaxID=2609290 RepID=UPI00361647F1
MTTAVATIRKRSVAIDGVRALGVVAVVAGHTWPNDAWVSNWFFSWHVPVFFVISGYLWTPDRAIGAELRKRARTLAVPYAAWFIVVAAIWLSVRAAMGLSVSSEPWSDLLIGGAHISRPWSAFWFISALFVASIGMRFLDRHSAILPWFVGSAALAWCYAEPSSARSLPLAAVQGAVGILFMCVGRFLRAQEAHIASPLVVGLIFISVPLVLTVADILPSLNLKAADLGEPIVTMAAASAISCGLILVARSTEPHWPRALRTVSTELARLGLPIILGHALVLGLLALCQVEPSVWSFLMALILPAAAGWLLSRTRVGTVFL